MTPKTLNQILQDSKLQEGFIVEMLYFYDRAKEFKKRSQVMEDVARLDLIKKTRLSSRTSAYEELKKNYKNVPAELTFYKNYNKANRLSGSLFEEKDYELVKSEELIEVISLFFDKNGQLKPKVRTETFQAFCILCYRIDKKELPSNAEFNQALLAQSDFYKSIMSEIGQLEKYKIKRESILDPYFFSFFKSAQFSRDQKISAADALIACLQPNNNRKLTQEEIKALMQGNLGKAVASIAKKRNGSCGQSARLFLSTFEDKSAPSAKSGFSFN